MGGAGAAQAGTLGRFGLGAVAVGVTVLEEAVAVGIRAASEGGDLVVATTAMTETSPTSTGATQ